MKTLTPALRAIFALTAGSCATMATAAPQSGEFDTQWGVLNSGKTSVGFFAGQNQNVALENTPSASVVGTKGSTRGIMYIAGTVTDLQNRTYMGVVALDRQGSPLTTFSGDGKNLTLDHDLVATAIALSPDESRIYVAGYRTTNAPDYDMVVCQFNTDNGTNTSFSSLPPGNTCITPQVPGAAQEIATDILVQPDGRIVVAGYSGVNLVNRNAAFARFEASGALDLGFGGDAEYNTALIRDSSKFVGHEINAIAPAADGGFYAVGYTRLLGQANDNGLLMLLDANGEKRPGSLAETANSEGGGAGADTHYQDVAVTAGANGDAASLVVVGRSEAFVGAYSAVIARFGIDGLRDNSYGESNGHTVVSAMNVDLAFTHVALQANDEAIVLLRRGSGSNVNTEAMRYDADGIQDQGFGGLGYTDIDFETVGGYNDPAGLSVLGNRGVYIAVGASNGGIDTNYHAAKLVLDGVFEDGFESE